MTELLVQVSVYQELMHTLHPIRIEYSRRPWYNSRYLIEEEKEEEDEDEELVGEERDVEALALKTEKDPLFNQNINN